MSNEIKDKVAISKGYKNWDDMYNWIARDNQYPVVVAQLIEAAMQEVIDALLPSPPTRLRDEGFLASALQGLVNDVRNKPNDTRYAAHLKIANEALEKYQQLKSLTDEPDYDEFTKKHLAKIWASTRESAIKRYIEPMFDSVKSASIQYFLDTGKVNGEFFINLMLMMDAVKNWKSQPTDEPDAGYREDRFKNWLDGMIESLQMEKELHGKKERIQARLSMLKETLENYERWKQTPAKDDKENY